METLERAYRAAKDAGFSGIDAEEAVKAVVHSETMELSLVTKLLLISAYLCSVNPPNKDDVYFTGSR